MLTIIWGFSESSSFCWWRVLPQCWWLLTDLGSGCWRLGWLCQFLKQWRCPQQLTLSFVTNFSVACCLLVKYLQIYGLPKYVVSDSLWPHGLYSPWTSPGQNTGVDSHSLLHGIFPTEGSNPGLPHCRRIVYHLSHQGSPRTLEWVLYPFSRVTSQPSNWTVVSYYVVREFFTSWATKETHIRL